MNDRERVTAHQSFPTTGNHSDQDEIGIGFSRTFPGETDGNPAEILPVNL